MAVTLAATRESSPPLASRRPPLMEKFVIQGGVPLSGTVRPAGNKNAALPLLAAAVLTTEPVVLRNVPKISRRRHDARPHPRPRRHASSGAATTSVLVDASGVSAEATIDRSLSERIRASFLLAGPLLARFGRASMPPPGGDVIGRRRLDPAPRRVPRARRRDPTTSATSVMRAPDGLRAGDVFMDEPSVMATENALMAAALTPGSTVIGNAACEPHIQDLARMLVKMGADITGIGSNVMTVMGEDRAPRLRPRRRARPHRDRQLHGARRRRPAASCASRTSSATTCA